MRTRIALTAVATAAMSLCISNIALAGYASGSPRRASGPAQPSHPAGAPGAELTGRTLVARWAAAEAPAPAGYLPGGFVAPALAAEHRRDRPRHAVERPQRAASFAGVPEVPALAAHVAQMERVVDAWRAAHPAPPVAPPPAPAPAPAPVVVTDATSTTTADWACIRVHESGDRYNTPAVPGGAYGFLESTWLSLGFGGWPYQAPAAVQDHAVLYLYHEFGWQPWSTRFVCGL